MKLEYVAIGSAVLGVVGLAIYLTERGHHKRPKKPDIVPFVPVLPLDPNADWPPADIIPLPPSDSILIPDDKKHIAKCRQKLEMMAKTYADDGWDSPAFASELSAFNADYPCHVFDGSGQPNADVATQLYNSIPGAACSILKKKLPYDTILFGGHRACPS